MRRGDHIFVSYTAFTHHGIYIDDDQVIELSLEGGGICSIPLPEFAEGRRVSVRHYKDCSSRKKVVQRAFSRLGESGYNLLTNNCEHFATWCKTGKAKSAQIVAVVKCGKKAGSKAFTSSAKMLAKGMVPGAIASDIAQGVTEYTCQQFNLKERTARNAGRGVGFSGHVATGAVVGGPVGAAIGCGAWAATELIFSILE